jgi:hypothetical protein
MKWTTAGQLALASLIALCHPTTAQSTPSLDDYLAILAGYHVIYSYPGVQPPAELYTLIS